MGILAEGAAAVGAESLAEFLDLVAALDGGFGGEEGGAAGEIGRNIIPVRGTEVCAAERVVFMAVGFDEG